MEQPTQWVQHISGQGEKWEIYGNSSTLIHCYCVKSKVDESALFIPKSEYVPCDTPEVWEDVTGECGFSDFHNHLNLCVSHASPGQYIPLPTNYRLRKITGIHAFPWAFIVERKKS